MVDNNIQLDADDLFVMANSTARVRAAVRKVSAGGASRARKELARAGIDAEVRVRERTLANGRATADIVADAPEGSEARVSKILRRAGREARGRS